jgi:DNA-binding helix-hairpin-helix protein with protein kinase domain
MTEAASPSLLKIAAWPVDLLSDSQSVVRGFIMPRGVTCRDIHELYSPKSQSEAFSEADFQFLVHVATNIARAFAVVHEHGRVVGDVNHGNLLVGADGTVMLIDCDSFQIGNSASVFTCDVGVPLFTALELHGRTFRGLVRATDYGSRPDWSNRSCHTLESNLGCAGPECGSSASFRATMASTA